MFGHLRTRRRPPAGPAPRPRLTLTPLEDRSVPAVVDLAAAYDPGNPTEYTPGLPITFTVTVTAATSNGSIFYGDATNASFTESLNGPVTNLQWTAIYNGASGPAGGTGQNGQIDITGLSFPAGSSATFRLTADTLSSGSVSVDGTATITANLPDIDDNASNDSDAHSASPVPQVDLQVQYSPAAPATYTPGLPVSYSILVTNNGPSDALSSSFGETLSGPGTNVRWTATYANGATGGPTSGTGDISLLDTLDIPAGGSITFVVTADTPSDTTAPFVDTAHVQSFSAYPDTDSSNDSVSATTTAAPLADLRLTNTVTPTTYTPGGTLTYTVTAVNAGPSDVPTAQLTDAFTGPVSGVTWTATYTGGATGPASGTGSVAAQLALPSGGGAVFTLTATISSPATGNVVSTASVTSVAGPPTGGQSLLPTPPVPDPNTSDNTATVTTPLRTRPPLPVFVVGGDGTPNVGDSIESVVGVYDASGNLVRALDPLGLVHGVRPGTAPVTAAGSVQVAVASGPGDPPRVVVVDTTTQQVLRSATPFGDDFTGGLNVAVGSLDGRTDADGNRSQFVVVGADDGGGPVVVVYRSSGGSLTEIARFLAFDDPGFRGGVRVAVGHLNEGYDDLAVVSGAGGGPRVRVFDGLALAAGQIKEKASFYAFDPAFRGGGYVAVGDLYGTGHGDIIFGAGAGGGPHVSVFDGVLFKPVANFYNREESFAGGVRVAARDLDTIADGRATLITGDGPGLSPADFGNPSQVRLYQAPAAEAQLPLTPDLTFAPFADFTGGVHVG